MMTLSICRPLLQARPRLLYWRLGAASVLCALLLSSLILTTSPLSPVNWYDLGYDYSLNRNVNVKPADPFWLDTVVMCSWKCSTMSQWSTDTVVAFVLVVVGFLGRVIYVDQTTIGTDRTLAGWCYQPLDSLLLQLLCASQAEFSIMVLQHVLVDQSMDHGLHLP
jgi:hypothetical protein